MELCNCAVVEHRRQLVPRRSRTRLRRIYVRLRQAGLGMGGSVERMPGHAKRCTVNRYQFAVLRETIVYINPLTGTCDYSAKSNNNYEVGTLAVDEWAVWYSEEGTERGGSPPRPVLAVPNVMASVPIIVLLYNGLFLCGFNVPIKGLIKVSTMS